MASPVFHAPSDMAKRDAVDEFYTYVADADLQPLWTQAALMPKSPPLQGVPYLWKWKLLRELAERSGELIPIDRGGDRRVLSLSNPGLNGLPFATSTLWAAIQYLGPGEVAPAHRHTPAALRFVLEGEGVWTLVNSDPVAMSPGDLVLTPSWSWHEHHNSGDTPMLWFDALDLPLVRSLDSIFFQEGPDQMLNRAVDPSSRSELLYAGGPGLVPLDLDEPAVSHSPLFAYRWAATDAALSAQLGVRGDGLAGIKFVDPTTSRDVMPTMRCSMHRVNRGSHTRPSKRVGSSVWVCFHGTGSAIVGGEKFDLDEGDIFVVPSWQSLRLEALTTLDLFCVSDAPVIEAVGLSRVEYDVD